MYLFSSFRQVGGNAGDPIAIFDIGSDSIGAAIARFSEDGKPHIDYETREFFPIQEDHSAERLSQAMLKTFETVLTRLQNEGLPRLRASGRASKKLRRAVYFFSSPWYFSGTRTIHTETKEPVKISGALLDALSGEARRDFLSAYTKEGQGEDKDAREAPDPIIDHHILHAKLNGYPTRKPLDKEASLVEVSVLFSVVAADLLEQMKNIFGKVFHYEVTLACHTFPLAMFALMDVLISLESDYLFMRVGGETSDVSLVKDHVLHETASMPFGVHTLVRGVAAALKTVPQETQSLLSVSATNRGSDRLSTNLKEALIRPQAAWTQYFQETLEHFLASGILPRHVFLLADDAMGEWFAQFVNAEPLSQMMFADRKFQVKALKPYLIAQAVASDIQKQDFSLLLEILYTDQVLYDRT